ncbi:helix-turn-helix transcriptional regulator [Kitasatospora putterlickiae]|uniref:Helix-turn-helix transcriptional regulator n=2 Tax=Kitasatospora putterlickiae TaxID=221725 RepID=A0ABP4J3P5_9ACTN
MREQAGFGGSQLARSIGATPAQITQMEAGRTGISVDRLRAVAAACMCVDRGLIDALSEIITRREKPGWWEEYRGSLPADFLDIAELEDRAVKLSTFTITFIPGLLQTRSYASAVFSQAFPSPTRHEVDLRTNFRLQRQATVRTGTKTYAAFIHEAALRMQFSGSAVLAEQLNSLIEDSRKPGISVRVVPFNVGTLPGPSENLTYAVGPVPELDTVQMDTGQGVVLFDSPPHLAAFRDILDRTASVALSEDESRAFILSVKGETEGKA